MWKNHIWSPTRLFKGVHFIPGVYATAAAFVLGGLSASSNVISLLSYLVAGGLVFWGTTVHGLHLWHWLKGAPVPLRVARAHIVGPDYAVGALVAGITWVQGYTHVEMWIGNTTGEPISNINLEIKPDRPIYRSVAHCDFAPCQIGVAGRPLPPMAVNQTGLAMPAQSQEVVGPPHRLWCQTLPGNAVIKIDLATAAMNTDLMGPWVPTVRSDPSYVDVTGTYTWAGQAQEFSTRLRFRDEPQSVS